MFFSPERSTKEKIPIFSPGEVLESVKEFIPRIISQEKQSNDPLKLSEDQKLVLGSISQEDNDVHTVVVRKLFKKIREAQRYVFNIRTRPTEIALGTEISAEVRAILGKDNNLKDIYISGTVGQQSSRSMIMPIHLLTLEEMARDDEGLYRLLQVPKRKKSQNESEGLRFNIDARGNIVRDLVMEEGDDHHLAEAVYIYSGPLVVKNKEYQVYIFNAALERRFVAAKGALRFG